MSLKTNIIVTTHFAALHHWPTIPDGHSQSYLKNPHRHVFHITFKKQVFHNDRDSEFIELKNQINEYLHMRFKPDGPDQTPSLGSMSCEDLAELLITEFDGNYCSVMEDGECGAEIIKYE